MMKTLLVDEESLSPLSKLYLHKLTHWDSTDVDSQIRELEAAEPLDESAKAFLRELQSLEASEPAAPEPSEPSRGCCCRVLCSVCHKHDHSPIRVKWSTNRTRCGASAPYPRRANTAWGSEWNRPESAR